MEGCYLHNPATLPSRAEPGEAPARPCACLARGAVAPRNNLPFSNPTWLFEGVGFGEVVISGRGKKKPAHRSGCALSSSVHRSEEAGDRRAEGRRGDVFGENAAYALGGWSGGQVVKFTQFTPLPLWLKLPYLTLSLKYKGKPRQPPRGSGVSEGVSARGRLCTRGRSGQSYAKPGATPHFGAFAGFKHWFSHAGSPFRLWGRLLPPRPQPPPQRPGPSRCAVCHRTCAGGTCLLAEPPP